MRGTPVARRPAEASAEDAPTVTRHAVERKEVIVVPAVSGVPLQVGSGEGVSTSPSPVPNLPKPRGREGTIIISCSGKQPTSKWGKS